MSNQPTPSSIEYNNHLTINLQCEKCGSDLNFKPDGTRNSYTDIIFNVEPCQTCIKKEEEALSAFMPGGMEGP